METRQIERLATLCKIWGAVKFFHPWLVYRDVDWDQALLDALPAARAAESEEDLRKAVTVMLDALGDGATKIGAGHSDPESPEPRARAGEALVVHGGIAIVRIAGIEHEDYIEAFRQVQTNFEGAAKADAIVLDLRGFRWMHQAPLRRFLRLILSSDLLLPGRRMRMHSGYTPQGSGSSGGYFSAWVVTDADRIAGGQTDEPQIPLAVICDGDEPQTCTWAAAFGMSAGASVVMVGEQAGGETTVTPFTADGITVSIRTSELAWTDGTIGFEPDARVDDEQADYLETAAVKRALELVRERPDRSRAQLPAPVGAPPAERGYAEPAYPDLDTRLLALFRYWNVIDRFFPYKHLLDVPWSDALTEFIPRFAGARDETEYVLAVAEMSTRMQDTHAGVSSKAYWDHIGRHYPPIGCRYIEGRPTVTAVRDDVQGVDVGDVFVSIDGISADARFEELARVSAASTPQALRWRISQSLLNGPEGDADLELEGPTGIKRVSVPRAVSIEDDPPRYEKALPVFGVLGSGYGYFDLDRLVPSQVDEAFGAVKDTRALIIDIRNYPHGTAWYIAPRLTDERVATATFRRPETRDPNAEWDGTLIGTQFSEPSGERYTGTVVCLIDEHAISQSEHTCLFLEAAADVVFIGSATNGANGDVTGFPLPGGLWARFTGHDVRHADGRQLQRVGIQPHVEVRPTIEGVRAGRDEVLETAVAYLDKQFS